MFNSVSNIEGIHTVFILLLLCSFVFGMKMMWEFIKNIPTKEELFSLVGKLENAGKDLSDSINGLRKEMKEDKADIYKEISSIRADTASAIQEVRFIKGVISNKL